MSNEKKRWINENPAPKPPDGYFFIGTTGCTCDGEEGGCGNYYHYYLGKDFLSYKKTDDINVIESHEYYLTGPDYISNKNKCKDLIDKVIKDLNEAMQDPSISPNSGIPI